MKQTNPYKSWFLAPYLLIFVVLLAAVFQYPKAELHLLMNSNHSPAADLFFRGLTEMGGVIPFIIIAGVIIYRFRAGIFLLAAQLAGGILVYTLKNIFSAPRPKLYFELYHPELTLPVVEGFKLWSRNSFPSGHSVTAFAFFFGLALIIKNRWWSLLLGLFPRLSLSALCCRSSGRFVYRPCRSVDLLSVLQ